MSPCDSGSVIEWDNGVLGPNLNIVGMDDGGLSRPFPPLPLCLAEERTVFIVSIFSARSI